MLLLIASIAQAYHPVDGIFLTPTTPIKVLQITESDNISYSVARMPKTAYSDSLIQKSILDSSLASIEIIQSITGGIRACRPAEVLEIFELPVSELNNHSRFPAEYTNSRPGEAWGYFDPRRDEKNINSIIVTPHTEYEDYQILTHEVAHHWYSAYCLDQYTKQTSEEFALQIQHQLEPLNDY